VLRESGALASELVKRERPKIQIPPAALLVANQRTGSPNPAPRTSNPQCLRGFQRVRRLAASPAGRPVWWELWVLPIGVIDRICLILIYIDTARNQPAPSRESQARGYA